jgi:hypothetical protein
VITQVDPTQRLMLDDAGRGGARRL